MNKPKYTYDPVGRGWPARIAARCRELGMTQESVGKGMGMSTSNVARLTTWSNYFSRLVTWQEKSKENRSGSAAYMAIIQVEGNEELIKAKRNTGRCAACGVHENSLAQRGRKDRLCMDHCHNTGQPRDLLCGACNMAEGLFEGRHEDLLKLFKYLENRLDP